MRSRIPKTVEYAAAVTLLALFVTVNLDVIGRYFLNTPITGSDEIVGMLMCLAVSLGLPLVSLHRKHISVDISEEFLSPHVGRIMRRIADLASIAGFALISIIMIRQAQAMLRFEQVSQALHLPLGLFAVAIAASAIVSFILIIVTLRTGWHDRQDPDGDVS